MSELNIVDVPWNVYPDSQVNAIPEEFDVCDELNYSLIQRIGSASMNGRVYEVEQNRTNTRIALKLMSIGNDDECKRATILGETCPLYFPRVVSWGTCQNVIVRNEGEEHSDVFTEFAEREFIKKYILDRTHESPIYKKRLCILMKKIHTTGVQLMRDLENIGVPTSILLRYRTHRGIAMTVMASELLHGDILNLVKENPRHEDIPRLIGEVFAAMRWLVRRQIVHEDLHLGNILLRSNHDGRLSAVIHDFGESTEDRSPYEHTRVIYKFLDALITSIHSDYENIVISARLSVDSFLQNSEPQEITQDDMIVFLRRLQEGFSSI